ncbi:hypothetical protein EB061_09850 [bacterium]|nr:hypothetical protein [bacterium]
MMKRLGFILPLLLLQACSPDTMPRYSTLRSLRVLALLINTQGANDSETGFDGTTFNPGTIEVTPVVSDLHGGGRSLSYNLHYCLDPGIALGAPPTCSGSPSRVDVATNALLSLPTGQYASPNYTGSLTPLAINLNTATASVLPAYAARFASLSAADRFNGFSVLVFFELFPTLDSSDKVTTFKRLVLSTGRALNQNPVTANFDLLREDGSAILPFPSQETFFKGQTGAADLESYSVLSASGGLQNLIETIEIAWFMTAPSDIACANDEDCTPDGFLALPRTTPGELNRFIPPKVATPTDRSRILIGIAKDNRGGAAIKRYEQTP